ncbi:hypothetical protein ABPG72_016494 [Tetrahymena utriculariae]
MTRRFNINLLVLMTILIFATLLSTKAHQEQKDEINKQNQEVSEQVEEKEVEIPLPQLKTIDQCKADCTLDWQDCVMRCGNDGPQKCYITCQTQVKKCLDECPNAICNDHCSIELEKCQRAKRNPGSCESEYNNCQEDCDNAYIGRTDL